MDCKPWWQNWRNTLQKLVKIRKQWFCFHVIYSVVLWWTRHAWFKGEGMHCTCVNGNLLLFSITKTLIAKSLFDLVFYRSSSNQISQSWKCEWSSYIAPILSFPIVLKIEKDVFFFPSCHERGPIKKILSPHEESNLRCSNHWALVSTASEVYYEVHMTRVLHTARISNVDSVMFLDRNKRDDKFWAR